MYHSIRKLGLVGLIAGAFMLLTFAWLPVSRADPSTPSTPILLIVNDTPPFQFGRYLGEILRAEGLNSFDVVDINSLTTLTLTQYDAAILAYTSLTSNQAVTLTHYVSNGGRLIAIRPDSQIASMFGLTTASGTLTDGYLKISNTAAFDGQVPGQGRHTETLQIHGQADQYNALTSAAIIARLYSNITTATTYPAVVAANYGSGQAAAFTYDLPQNIAYTRQGNPANANIDVDGDGVTRTIDLFLKIGGGAPWVDRDRISIPQADEQQRLFARLVQQLVASTRPLPQLWYFPGDAKTMLILTGDAHGNPTSYYQNEIDSINAHGGKITFYLSQAAEPTNASVQAWRAQGHEFGIHPYAFVSGAINNLSEGYTAVDNWFSSTFASTKSATVRNHQVAWEGWTDAAEIAVAHGIALDTSFYHWGNWLQKPDLTWPHGYITGSGQPMKFIRADGTVLPIYQQLTELVDEQLVLSTDTATEGLTGLQAAQVSKQLIDASLAGDYAALMTQDHVDYYGNGDPQIWAEGTMAYANSRGVPIWNADQWLSFVETRHDANYTNIAWDNINNTLTFSLTAAATPGVTLTTMLPLQYGVNNLKSVTVDGAEYTFTVQTIKDVNVAFVTVPAGNHSFTAAYQTGASSNTSQTTVSDFSSCAVLTNTRVSPIDGGAVVLTAQFADDFNGTSLDLAKWSSGDWLDPHGSYNPLVSGGIITVENIPNGGWVRSNSAYNHGIMEFTAQFGSDNSQLVGFGSNDFSGNFYFLFSTRSPTGTYTSDLWARANNNASEQYQSLGPIPVGMHRYRIEWGALDTDTDSVEFYLDDVFQASWFVYWDADLTKKPSNLYLYLSNDGDAPLQIDSVQVTPYYSSGAYASCTFDAGAGSVWQAIVWDAVTPVSTSLTVETRSSANATNWTSWAPAIASGSVLSPMLQYAQYRLLLDTSDPNATPQVNWVMLTSIHPGQTYTWTGSTSTAWDGASNWSSNQVPASYDDAVIPGASVTNWPTVNVITSVHNLTLQSGAQLTVSNPITVSGIVSNSGGMYQTRPVTNLNVPVEFLHLQDGLGNDKYRGVIITPTADMGNVTVIVRGNQNCSTSGVLRCYEVTPQTTADADIQFFYRQAEANGNNMPNVYHWVAGSGWTSFASTRGSNGNEAFWVRATVNEYSPFALSDYTPTAVTLAWQGSSTGKSPAPIWLAVALVSIVIMGIALKQRIR
jgi:hypothetical protein